MTQIYYLKIYYKIYKDSKYNFVAINYKEFLHI
jgi:hypothetical protein